MKSKKFISVLLIFLFFINAGDIEDAEINISAQRVDQNDLLISWSMNEVENLQNIVLEVLFEIPDRSKAISEAIKNLSTGEILLVAGKGHEKIQVIGRQKIYFSDKEAILSAIKIKNKNLSNNLKLNIIRDLSGHKKIFSKSSLGQARINSREVKKNDIFFAIKGKKKDGNKFVNQAFKNKASIVVVNHIQKKFQIKRQRVTKQFKKG